MVLYQFKGERGNEKVDCGIGIDSEITENRPESIVLSFSAIDSEYRRIIEGTTTITPDSLYRITGKRGEIVVIHLPLEIPPLAGSILVAVEVVNSAGKVKAVAKSHIKLIDFLAQKPSISSIKLNIISEDGECTSFPDPLPVYESGDNICAEYEIYNLKTGSDGLAKYTISYEINSLKPPEGLYAKGLSSTLLYILRKLKLREEKKGTVITSSFEQSVSSKEAVHKTIINTRGLKSGPYEIVIQVRDKLRGNSVSRSSYFLIR